jgi:3-phosphoshikimate 1-carboxyvinyltransferase
MDDLVDALRSLGVEVNALDRPGRLPLEITGPITGGHVAVAGDVSSQYTSGLLLAGGVAGLSVSLTTEAISRPYLDMTARVMEAFGATVSGDDGDTWHVGGGYRAVDDFVIEPDASAASYFLAAAAMTAGRVRIEGLGRHSMQGDVAFADVLAQMGAEVEMGDEWIEVRGGTLHGIEVDLRHISDTAPTLAAVAAVADGPTTVTGIGFVRGKESDRIGGPVRELRRCGVPAEVIDDGFVVRPSGPPTAARIETYDDHRMAMAFALIGLVVPGIDIVDPGCVAKTFPGYFAALDQLR